MAKEKFLQDKAKLTKIIVIAGAVIVLAGVVFLYVKYGLNNEGAKQTPAEKVQATSISAQDAQLAGNSQEANKLADEAIAYAEGDTAAQAEAYVIKSSIAFNDKDYQAAFDAARQAEAMAPSSLTSALIGNAARELKDNQTAAQYYQITIDRIKALKFHNETDVKYYEKLLKEVKSE